MAGALDRSTARGQVVPLVFGQTDLAASQTNVQLVTAIAETGQATDGYTMPWDGEIIGVSWSFTTAPTAGTMTVGATVGGTEDADTTGSVTVNSSATSGSKLVQREKARFVAGNVIGCEITTDGSWLPITADVVAVVWVLFNVDGI